MNFAYKTRPLAEWCRNSFTNKDIILVDVIDYDFIRKDRFLEGSYVLVISNKKYNDWLTTLTGILFNYVFKDIPQPLTECKKLLDENVLKIKKLEKDIGNLNDIIFKETKIFYFHDDSNFIPNTFVTELNKKIQCYGFISLLYTKSNYQLVNSTNRLKSNVLNNDQRDHLIFQLEDILSPYQIKTTDSKISDFSILAA